jgi:hypothetical protein
MNAPDRLLKELQTLGGKIACHLRHACYVTARMSEALNHPGLDGVASVRSGATPRTRVKCSYSP